MKHPKRNEKDKKQKTLLKAKPTKRLGKATGSKSVSNTTSKTTGTLGTIFMDEDKE